MTPNQLVIIQSHKYVGCHEGDTLHREIVDGYNSILPHPRGYKLKYTDSWCAAFVSWVMYTAGISTFPYECGVSEMLELMYKKNMLIRGRLPYSGEVVFFNYSHVGLCLGSDWNSNVIAVREGNANDSVIDRYYRLDGGKLRCFAAPYFYSEQEVAQHVQCGWYGNGEERKRRLTEDGYDYNRIQSLVNRMSGRE